MAATEKKKKNCAKRKREGEKQASVIHPDFFPPGFLLLQNKRRKDDICSPILLWYLMSMKLLMKYQLKLILFDCYVCNEGTYIYYSSTKKHSQKKDIDNFGANGGGCTELF